MVTEVINESSSMAVDSPYCFKQLNVREWDCLAVHENAALWVMGASHSTVRAIRAVGSHAAGRTLALWPCSDRPGQ